MNKNITENVAQSTNNLANKMFDKLDVVLDAGKVLDNQSVKNTQDLLEAGLAKANNIKDLSSREYENLTNALSQRFTKKPVQSAFVIAGIGAFLAIMLTRSNQIDRRY